MPRTQNGLPGIHNATPLTLPDGAGAALALNASGQLLVDTSGGGNNSKMTITGSGGDVSTHDSQGDDIPSTAIGLTTEALGWHWSVALATWARNYGDTYTNIPNAVSVPFTGARLYALNGSNAVPLNADTTGALKISYQNATPTNHSGTIAADNVAQQLMPANPIRKGFWIQNNSSGDLWVNDLGAATAAQPSLKLEMGDYYESPAGGAPVGAISIIGATLGQTFSAREW